MRQPGGGDHVADAIDDGRVPGAADRQRREEAGQRLQRDVHAEHAVHLADLGEADRRGDTRRMGGVEDVGPGPVYPVGLQGTLIPVTPAGIEIVAGGERLVQHLAGLVQVHGRDMPRAGDVEDQLGVGAALGVAPHHGEIAEAVGGVEAFQVRHLVEHAAGKTLDGRAFVGNGVAGHHVARDQGGLGRRTEIAAHLAGDTCLQPAQHRLGQDQGARTIHLIGVQRDAQDGEDDQRHAQHGHADAQQRLPAARDAGAADIDDLVDGQRMRLPAGGGRRVWSAWRQPATADVRLLPHGRVAPGLPWT